MDWYHPSLGLIGASQAFTLGDVQYPADWLRLASNEGRTALGFLPVQTEARPDDKLFFVSEQTVRVEGDVAVVGWASTPRDPADVAKAAALEQIAALEGSITDRRWREAGPDDAGGTAEGRAWLKAINDDIAVLRTRL